MSNIKNQNECKKLLDCWAKTLQEDKNNGKTRVYISQSINENNSENWEDDFYIIFKLIGEPRLMRSSYKDFKVRMGTHRDKDGKEIGCSITMNS